jgi:hypothetical protein
MKFPLFPFFALPGAVVLLSASATAAATTQTDICIYGDTCAGIAAALEAKKLGHSVALISPSAHLGGMTSCGLSFADVGNPNVVGGTTHDFFHRLWSYYQQPSAWTFEQKSHYGNKGQGGPALNDTRQLAICFEPHVAENIFNQLVSESGITVVKGRLELKNGVVKQGARIISLRTEDGRVFGADVFIDASYEGDLMAHAGVSYTVGREANAQYGETADGIETHLSKNHNFPPGIDPYVKPGDPSSGLLPGVKADPGGPDGAADKKIQAYCYRLCLTDNPADRVAIGKPPGYTESNYEMLFRAAHHGEKIFALLGALPNRKVDANNGGGISFDAIGINYGYPEAGYPERDRIAQAHELWQRGLLWTLQNSPRIPAAIRLKMQKWGLAKDEFTDTNNWPSQLYIREARRMIGEVVMTQPMIEKSLPEPHSIGMGSYTLDSHNTQRYIDAEHHLRNEGNIEIPIHRPYQIDYGVITPRTAECENLLVPVCLSASHLAYGSIRMESVFMILGQSAGAAASLAVENHLPVQQVAYDRLKAQLVKEGQILEAPGVKN